MIGTMYCDICVVMCSNFANRVHLKQERITFNTRVKIAYVNIDKILSAAHFRRNLHAFASKFPI